MITKYRRLAAAAVGLVCACAMAPRAMAQGMTSPGSPSAQNEQMGATSGLGSSHRFPTAAAAANHCGGTDPVVWTDGAHLTYYPSSSAQYGKSSTHYGFYACKSEADSDEFQAGN